MSKFNLICIDLAKNVFQVGQFFHQKLQSNKAVSRKELLSILTTSPRCKVVIPFRIKVKSTLSIPDYTSSSLAPVLK